MPNWTTWPNFDDFGEEDGLTIIGSDDTPLFCSVRGTSAENIALATAAPALVDVLEDALLASGYGVAAPIPDSVRYGVPAWVFVARKLLAEVKGQPHA